MEEKCLLHHKGSVSMIGVIHLHNCQTLYFENITKQLIDFSLSFFLTVLVTDLQIFPLFRGFNWEIFLS